MASCRLEADAQPRSRPAEARHMNPFDMRLGNDLPAHLNTYTRDVIGAAIEVHRHLGPGFQESVYEEAMLVELGAVGFRYQQQVSIPIEYKSHRVGLARIDLLIEEELVLELKAVESVLPVHKAQALSYLKAGGYPLALLINFNVPVLKDGVHRLIRSTRWRPRENGTLP